MLMDERLIELSQLPAADLERLAVLHVSVMHTLLSDLGLPLVRRYYQVARADPNVIGLCFQSVSGEIVGWAMGSSSPDRINAQLRFPLAWFALQMFRVLLTRPLVLLQLIASIFASSSPSDLKVGAVELTYIGVASAQRRKGLARKLLNAFIEASRAHGYRSVVLSVEQENTAAIALYQKAGFQTIKIFKEGHYQRHRMELTLA